MTLGQPAPRLRPGLEALLFLADEPVGVETAALALEAGTEEVTEALEALAREYAASERGITVRRYGGGWRMYTAEAAKPVVERWALAGRTGRLTQAALETLAVIAYKQPISRQRIGEIRGVNADGAVRSLAARGLVEAAGHDEGPGQAVLYATTTMFLERLGVASLDELPPLTDYLPESPAPDEPELGTLHEVRRRLARGGELSTTGGGSGEVLGGGSGEVLGGRSGEMLGGRSGEVLGGGSGEVLGGRSADETNTGPLESTDDDAMPPPVARAPADDDDMDELADRLDEAARNAVGRLRGALSAVAAREADEAEPDEADPDEADPDDDPPAETDETDG